MPFTNHHTGGLSHCLHPGYRTLVVGVGSFIKEKYKEKIISCWSHSRNGNSFGKSQESILSYLAFGFVISGGYSACTTKAKIIPKEIYIMFNFKIINQNIVFYIFLLKHGNIPILNQISNVSEIVYNCTCGCSRLYMCVYMVVHVCTKT